MLIIVLCACSCSRSHETSVGRIGRGGSIWVADHSLLIDRNGLVIRDGKVIGKISENGYVEWQYDSDHDQDPFSRVAIK